MKPTTSSKTGLFLSILFAVAAASAVASLTGCGAAPGDETAATSTDEQLDETERLPVKKVAFDPAAAADFGPAPAKGVGGGGGGDVDGVAGNGPAKKNNL